MLLSRPKLNKNDAFDQSDRFDTVDKADNFQLSERLVSRFENETFARVSDCSQYCHVLMLFKFMLIWTDYEEDKGTITSTKQAWEVVGNIYF